MPQVLNKKTIGFIPTNAVYVGRGSKWGNPFPITATQSRAEVMEKYRDWSADKVQEMRDLDNGDWLKELRGKHLVCYCAPLPCHADILLEMIG